MPTSGEIVDIYREQTARNNQRFVLVVIIMTRLKMKIGQKAGFQAERSGTLFADRRGETGREISHFYSTKYQDKIRNDNQKWYTGMKKYHLVDIME